jgi:hypothetical protein
MNAPASHNSLDELKNSIIFSSEELMRRKALTYTKLEEEYVKCGFSESNGAVNLIKKVRDYTGSVGVDLKKLENSLRNLLETHIKFNNKIFNLYRANEKILKEIYTSLTSRKRISKFFDATNSTMIDDEKDGPLLEEDGFSIFYFKTSRPYYYKDRIIENDEKKHSYDNELNGELIDLFGKWKISLHCFDFIAIDLKNNYIAVGFDFGSFFRKGELGASKEKLERIIGKNIRIAALDSVNFYPCLKNMHDERDASGNLIGSILGHRMLTFEGENVSAFSSSNRTDLRVGKYHEAGSQAVKRLDFHGIFKLYKLNTSSPVIMIKEDLKILRKQGSKKVIFYALVDDLKTIYDLRFCFVKLLELS